jgi:fused signal recognition particle receptor
MGLFDKLKQGLQRTSQQLKDRLDRLDEMVGLAPAAADDARTREIDVDTADALEELLLMADVGVAASGEIVEAVRKRQRRGESLRQLVKEEMLRILESADTTPKADVSGPRVFLIVGVNGVGKPPPSASWPTRCGWKERSR